jgi:hypothetical protein
MLGAPLRSCAVALGGSQLSRSECSWSLVVWAAALALGISTSARASASFGNLLGVYAGNDSATSIERDLGFAVLMLDRVDLPRAASDALSITVSSTKGGEPIAGGWSYPGTGPVDLIVVKAGNRHAIYRYGAVTGAAASGLWDTAPLGAKELSHLSAYRIVPEPGTAALLGVGLLSLGWSRSRGSSGTSLMRMPR